MSAGGTFCLQTHPATGAEGKALLQREAAVHARPPRGRDRRRRRRGRTTLGGGMLEPLMIHRRVQQHTSAHNSPITR